MSKICCKLVDFKMKINQINKEKNEVCLLTQLLAYQTGFRVEIKKRYSLFIFTMCLCSILFYSIDRRVSLSHTHNLLKLNNMDG